MGLSLSQMEAVFIILCPAVIAESCVIFARRSGLRSRLTSGNVSDSE
jgi:hypothetical protein